MITASRLNVGVFGLAVNKQKQFLLTQRNAPDSPATHLKWQIPGGGLESNESPEQTCLRELREEIGVQAQIAFPHPIASNYIWRKDQTSGQEDVNLIILTYIVDIGEQIPSDKNDAETLAWQWYSLDEVERLDTLPNVKATIRAAFTIIQ